MKVDLLEELSKVMYDEYCRAVGGKAFNGDKLPTADDFFVDDTKKKQADAWRAAAAEGIKFAQNNLDLITSGLDKIGR